MNTPFDREIKPDWKEFVETILRKRTPKRVHCIESSSTRKSSRP